MPFITYTPKNFRASSLEIISRARTICEEYARQGLTLSLRQLYYQFVSRDWLANKQSEYSRLGDIVADARLAGLLDWNWLEDRGRSVTELGHWANPESILDVVGRTYRVDKWNNQPNRVMVMVEKDALTGVFEGVCNQLDVPLFACKGYPSASSLWDIAYRRLRPCRLKGQKPIVLHFGDHDPSGIQMTEDLRERLALLSGGKIEVRRIALTIDQVRQFQPPPNPAKETDSRIESYRAQFGDESWELDALPPNVLVDLVRDNVLALRDDDIWESDRDAENADRRLLTSVGKRWEAVTEFLETLGNLSDDYEEGEEG